MRIVDRQVVAIRKIDTFLLLSAHFEDLRTENGENCEWSDGRFRFYFSVKRASNTPHKHRPFYFGKLEAKWLFREKNISSRDVLTMRPWNFDGWRPRRWSKCFKRFVIWCSLSFRLERCLLWTSDLFSFSSFLIFPMWRWEEWVIGHHQSNWM